MAKGGEHEGGAELASGYVSLSVRYASATSQIRQDFGGYEAAAAATGTKIGSNLSGGASAGINALKAKNLELRQSILNAGSAYENLKSSGTATAEELSAAHSKLNGLMREGKQASLDLSNASFAASTAMKAGVSDAAGVVKGLSANLSESAGAVSTLGFAAGGATGQVAGIGGALAGLAANPVVLVTGAVIALTAAAAAAVTGLYNLGEQWTTTFDQLEIKTGATGQRLAEMEAAVKQIAPNVSLGIGQLGNVVAAVGQQFHDTGSALATVSQEYARFQLLTGSEDSKSLGRVFSVFGAENNAQKQIAIMQQLDAAYHATGVPIDQLTSVMSRVDLTTKQFNLSAGQTLGLLASFDQAGIDPAKSVIALNTAYKEAVKQGKPFNTFLQDQFTQIKALMDKGDAASMEQAATLAKTDFGLGARGGGTAIMQALSAGMDPQNLSKLLDTAMGPSIDQQYEKAKHFSGAWTEAMNAVKVALEPMATKVFDELEGPLEKLAAWIGSHTTQIVGFFVDIGKAVTVMAAGIAVGIAMVLGTFGTMILAVGKLVEAVGVAVDSIGQAF